jgi:signal transduction histidine kinase/DNA-binding response OmpR family regulator
MSSIPAGLARCRVLHLEDSPNDAFLVRRALTRGGLAPEIVVAETGAAFHAALGEGQFDVVLSDSSVPGLNTVAALAAARARFPGIPFFCVSSAPDLVTTRALKSAGVGTPFAKDKLEDLAAAVKAALTDASTPTSPAQSLPARTADRAAESRPSVGALSKGSARLVLAVQQLSLARSVEAIREIVRKAARELTGADGATFVLRDGDKCHYVDEDAITPLWKGQKFPLTACISGWAMLNRQAVAIEDIYQDPRIPHDAYRPTFVKSLVMVPIRAADPVGSIGNYWAQPHRPTPEEIELLSALADSTSVAMENVRVYAELEQRVLDRTTELQAANAELEAFSYSVSHDLRAPLNVISGFNKAILEDHAAQLGEEPRQLLEKTNVECARMRALIEDLLRLAQITRLELQRHPVDVSAMAAELIARLKNGQPERDVDVQIGAGMTAIADAGLLRAALENLLSNAWKYSGKRARAEIRFGRRQLADGSHAFFVSDNGAGFDPAQAARLFAPFHRLHSSKEFPGTGVGLATVQRIVLKHGGRIWAEARPNEGATFFFTLPSGLTGS